MKWPPKTGTRLTRETQAVTTRNTTLIMKGHRVNNLASFVEHFSPDVLHLNRTGCLEIWLREQGLHHQADAVQLIPETDVPLAQMRALSSIFEIELNEFDLTMFCFWDRFFTQHGEYRPTPPKSWPQ